MKFVVKQGTKKSPPLSARQILRHHLNGTFSSDAIVEDAKGRQKSLSEFVARLSDLDTSSNVEIPTAEPQVDDSGDDIVEGEIADFLTAGTAGMTETSIPSKAIEDPSLPTQQLNDDWQPEVRLGDPPKRRSPPMPTKGKALPECAFPGSLISLLTDAVASHVKPARQIGFPRGQIEGVLMIVGFAALSAGVIYTATQAEVDTALRLLITVCGLCLLFLLFTSVHFLNVRLIQFQRQMFRPVYACADRLIIQAVVVSTSFAIAGVLFALGWTALSSFFLNDRFWGLIVIAINGVLAIVVLRGLLYCGTHLENLGISEDPEATATQTYLAALIAVLRAPLLISSTIHFVGSMGVMVIGVSITLSVFDVWASGALLASILIPLVFSCLLYPVLTTLNALVGGISIELVNAVLSIERSLREQKRNASD